MQSTTPPPLDAQHQHQHQHISSSDLGRVAAQHTYATRIRQNSALRPSVRIRQQQQLRSSIPPQATPPPRRIKPVPSSAKPSTPKPTPTTLSPVFPPPNVVLHPDDATNKVLMAIGRAFLSVDNRAMTIKDLAELAMAHGLNCQNASAAGQAITTFIRTHSQRCEAENDQPLVLRHQLSGTATDDDLVPALHSRAGGAHSGMSSNEAKMTAFRRGTMVWYLSKAAGGPCPFARSGICLRDYDSGAKVPGPRATGNNVKEKKPEQPRPQPRKLRDDLRDQPPCIGRKRKRLARACADNRKSGEESDAGEQRPPPKVKISLRLKPLRAVVMSSSSGSGSSTTLPQCTLQQQQQPTHLLLSKGADQSHVAQSDMSDVEEGGLPPFTAADSPLSYPSVNSMDYEPTPPPESDEELQQEEEEEEGGESSDVSSSSSEEDDHVGDGLSWSPQPESEDEEQLASNVRRYSDDAEDDDDMDFDFDWSDDGNEADLDVSASPAPPSPLFFKQESNLNWVLPDPSSSTSIGDLLSITPNVKLELDDARAHSSWLAGDPSSVEHSPLDLHIKQEESEVNLNLTDLNLDFDLHDLDESTPNPFTSSSIFSTLSPVEPSPSSASAPYPTTSRRPSEVYWKNLELQGPEDVPPEDFEDCELTYRTVRAQTAPPSSLPELGSSSTSAPSAAAASSLPRAVPLSPPATAPAFLINISRPQWHSSFTSAGLSIASESARIEIPGTPTEISSSVHSWSSPESMRDSVGPPSPPLRSLAFLPSTFREEQVVYTIAAHTPAISATHFEGIPVYQAVIGTMVVYRRADTNYVHLNPLCAAYQVQVPDYTSILDAFLLSEGSPSVLGSWAPLETARTFVEKIPHHPDLLTVFLSQRISEYFPDTLLQLHHTPPRPYFGFGPPFSSTLNARPLLEPRIVPVPETPLERGMLSHDDVEGILASKLDLGEPLNFTWLERPKLKVKETPLSPIEKDMFHELCGYIPDWEDEMAVDDRDEEEEEGDTEQHDRAAAALALRALSPISSLSPSPPPESAAVPTSSHAGALKPKSSSRPVREPTRRSKRMAEAAATSTSKTRTLPIRTSKRRSAT